MTSSRFQTLEGGDEGPQLALVFLSEFPAPQGEIGPWLGSGVERAIYLGGTGWFPIGVAFADEAMPAGEVPAGPWGCWRPQRATVCCRVFGFRCFGGDRWGCSTGTMVLAAIALFSVRGTGSAGVRRKGTFAGPPLPKLGLPGRIARCGV